jgi:GNAT superfamily N-acetyltransferase
MRRAREGAQNCSSTGHGAKRCSSAHTRLHGFPQRLPAASLSRNFSIAAIHKSFYASPVEFAINKLTPGEIPSLLGLIHELAQFEKLEVAATAEMLHEAFFGPRPAAGALVAHCGSDIVGYAIYFFTFSSFVGRPGIWLEDVYVRPAFRRQGLGKSLIKAVARIGAERNCGRYEWTALHWNQNALDCYKKLGAQIMDEWVLLRMNDDAMRRLCQV